MDQNLISLQQELYSNLKKRVRDIFGPESSELTRYRRDYQRLASKHIFTISSEKFISRVKQADIIFLGDFHTFDQNIRNFERIVRDVFPEKQLAIGIEFVDSSKQIYVDQFLNDQISEIAFLELINYSNSWRFPWTHYQKIFSLAKEHRFNIIALNSSGKLKARDQHAANLMESYFNANPQSKMIVLFGEYHLVADKLPGQVKKKLPNYDCLTIHQNIDQLYWKLIKKKSDLIFSFNQSEYLLLSSPPWIKYESMIYWYENLSDDPDFDIHQYLLENGTKTFSENAEENFNQLMVKLTDLLKIDCSKEKLEDFNLLDHRKLDYLHALAKKNYPPPIQRFYRKLIKNGKSFKLLSTNCYYCSNYSINRLSFLAGIHIHNILCQETLGNIDHVLVRGKQTEKFLYFLYQSLFSYFCSKLLNPFRKCDLYRDVQARIDLNQTSKKKRRNLQLALAIIDHPHTLTENISHGSLRGLHSTAKTIGNMLGDWIFDELYQRKKQPIDSILPILLGQIYSPDKLSDDLILILSKGKFRQGRKRLF